MTIALIRHGQTVWNAEGRMQGRSDIPLNETGREQARDAGAALAGSSWEVIVSSPLSRARETASIIAAHTGLELGASYDILVERDYGVVDGLTMAEITEQWGDDRDFPGLESIESVAQRGTSALDQIAADHPGRRVIVVCHGTLIRHTLATVAGHPVDQILNGSISTLERHDDGWRVLTVNGAELPVPA